MHTLKYKNIKKEMKQKYNYEKILSAYIYAICQEFK